MSLMQNEIHMCPNCKREIYFCFDEWGHTPCHLHCDICDINIGSTSFNKCLDLLKDYHKPKTYIEYYCQEIKLLYEDGKLIINKEQNHGGK